MLLLIIFSLNAKAVDCQIKSEVDKNNSIIINELIRSAQKITDMSIKKPVKINGSKLK